MNNKMAKKCIYQQLNLINQLSKQEQRQNHGYVEALMVARWEGVVR